MLKCTKYEARKIMEGKATGIIMRYDVASGCPHKVKGELVFTNGDIDPTGKRQVPFGRATIVSIRPGTVNQFCSDKGIYEMDGFPNGTSMKAHLRVKYKGIPDTANVFHIRFRMEEIDRKAGLRGDAK